MASYEDILQCQPAEAQCKLCNIIIKNNKEAIDTHLQGVSHFSLYLQRMMIQNSIAITLNGPYCSLCKHSLSDNDIKKHIRSSQHKKSKNILEDIIEGDYIDLPDLKSPHRPSVYCVLCNCNIKYMIEPIRIHVDGMEHKRARSIAVQPLNGIFSVEGTNDELWCKICDFYFGNHIERILSHVDNNDYHNDELGQIDDLIEGEGITIDDYLTIMSEDKATCNRCGVKIPCNYHNLKQHVRGDRHQNNTKAAIKSCGNVLQ